MQSGNSPYATYTVPPVLPCPDLEHVVFEEEDHHEQQVNHQQDGAEHQQKHGNTCRESGISTLSISEAKVQEVTATNNSSSFGNERSERM